MQIWLQIGDVAIYVRWTGRKWRNEGCVSRQTVAANQLTDLIN